MAFHEKLEFFYKGYINYEFLKHKKLKKKQNNINLDLEVEF